MPWRIVSHFHPPTFYDLYTFYLFSFFIPWSIERRVLPTLRHPVNNLRNWKHSQLPPLYHNRNWFLITGGAVGQSFIYKTGEQVEPVLYTLPEFSVFTFFDSYKKLARCWLFTRVAQCYNEIKLALVEIYIMFWAKLLPKW